MASWPFKLVVNNWLSLLFISEVSFFFILFFTLVQNMDSPHFSVGAEGAGLQGDGARNMANRQLFCPN